MKYLFFVIVLIGLFGCDTSNNIPDPNQSYFIRYYGTNGKQEGVDMVANDDGTFLLLGTSTIGADKQIYLVKVNHLGDVLLEKFYGGPDKEVAIDMEPIDNGNYVILANVESTSSGKDILLITIDGEGNQINTGTFSYSGFSDEAGVTVTQLMDGSAPAGFIVAGSTDYDSIPNSNADGFVGITSLFQRFNNDCSLYAAVWSNHRSSSGNDYCTKAIQVDDLNSSDPFLLFGYTNSDPNNISYNYWSSRLNAYGGGLVLEQGILIGSPSTSSQLLGSVTVSSMAYNNYLLSGVSTDDTGNDNVFIATSGLSLMKPMALGNINLGAISNYNSTLLSDQVSASFTKVTAWPSVNSGYVIAANSVESGKSNMVITRIGPDGTELWDNPVILGGPGDDYESAIYEMPDGRIICFGTMSIGDDAQKKMALIKMNSEGKFK